MDLILPIRKFEIKEFGEYPQIMKEEVENPKYKVVYKNEKPFSRVDFEKFD